MPYYLIKQWTPHRGQTEDAPGCFFGPGYSASSFPKQIRSDSCYSSLKRAQNYASKCYSIYSPTRVVAVPDDIVARFVRVPEVPYMIKEGSQYDAVITILSGEKTAWSSRIRALVFYDAMRIQAWHDNLHDLVKHYDCIIANLCEGATVCPDNEIFRFNK